MIHPTSQFSHCIIGWRKDSLLRHPLFQDPLLFRREFNEIKVLLVSGKYSIKYYKWLNNKYIMMVLHEGAYLLSP